MERLLPIKGELPDWTSLFKTKPPKAGASESKSVQPFWSRVISQLPTTSKVVLVDKHTTTSFGHRKPDIVGYRTGQSQSVVHIAVIGELKARRPSDKGDFDDDEKGHLESFLEELLITYQPWRSSMFGFLSDGVLIQFFQLAVGPRKKLLEGPVLRLDREGAIGLRVLLDGHDYEGLEVTINGAPVDVKDYLGSGSSAVVFSGKHNGAIPLYHHLARFTLH
jgi:hypothetical protein